MKTNQMNVPRMSRVPRIGSLPAIGCTAQLPQARRFQMALFGWARLPHSWQPPTPLGLSPAARRQPYSAPTSAPPAAIAALGRRQDRGACYDPRSQSVCSAFCVGPDVVATAAHCLYRTASEKPLRLTELTVRLNGSQQKTTCRGRRARGRPSSTCSPARHTSTSSADRRHARLGADPRGRALVQGRSA